MKKINNLKIKNPFFLAPMHKVNDIAFRLLCKKNNCGLTYTWLLNPLSKEKLFLDDKPALQIATSNVKGLREFIKKYEKKVSLFDLNLGCPVLKAKKQRYGYYLQSDPNMVERILKVMRSSTKKPISMKIRKGPNALKIIKLADKYCDAIAIHPRTAEQGYSGKADIKWALKMKRKCSIAVIYSGNADENNVSSILKNFDFIMIGRNAVGNPGIFSKLTSSKEFNDFFDYLELAKKYKLSFSQIKFQALNFCRGRKNAKKIRAELIGTKDIKEIVSIFRNCAISE